MNDRKHIALLGNYPPRRCGIATFTADTEKALLEAFPAARVDIVAMDDGSQVNYSDDISLIVHDDPASYLKAAHEINCSGAEILWLQHEYGIFGGSAGEYILTLLNQISIPVAVTMHSILEKPDPDQRRVTKAMLAMASQVIVMAEEGRRIIHETYGVAQERIAVIPHGIPDRPQDSPEAAKARLGLNGRRTVLTFGLLSPDKGVGTMIEALPEIVKRVPETTYVILGATHPHLANREGEKLRDQLKARAEELGVADNIMWIDRFVEFDDLMLCLSAAEVYVTPYLNPAQITSGTLSYAAGLGRAIISTPYVHASELLADGCGILVDFGDEKGLSTAVARLLLDDSERQRVGDRAYAKTREMTWPCYALKAMDLFRTIKPTTDILPFQARRSQQFANFDAVINMSDHTGILQHSMFSVPNRDHGYCIDDNARALILTARSPALTPDQRKIWTATFAAFVQHGWNDETKRFRNFMSYDRQWLEDQGSEDSCGRAIWALGITARDHADPVIRKWAAHLYCTVIDHFRSIESPRACAFLMLGAAAFCETAPDHKSSRKMLEDHAERLLTLLRRASRDDWHWFENVLAYDNCRLPEAMLRASQILENREYRQAGLSALEWIAERQISEFGHFRAVGSESFGQVYAEPQPFDQQPLEAWAMIDACAAALHTTGDPAWAERARSAFAWFLGKNDAGTPLGDMISGNCFDGLMPAGVNRNQGAESVLAWQLAIVTYHAIEERVEAKGQSVVAVA